MSERITAIVENGLLRPTTPLGLPDGTRLEVTIASTEVQPSPPKRKKSPAEIMAEIAALPIECPDPDPNTSRDHDYYLYGAPRQA
jgi:predicted DNA-binding antitoxin AbrB/MazE fold protein